MAEMGCGRMPAVADALSLVAVACSAVALLVSLVSWVRGAPARLEQGVAGAMLEVEALAGDLKGLRREWASFEEQAEGVLTSVETRRKRIAAAEGKRARRENGAAEVPDFNDATAWAERARRQGLTHE